MKSEESPLLMPCLFPSSKQVQQELKKTMDLLKTAVNRAPFTTLETTWDMEGEDEGQGGPEAMSAGG